MGIDSAGTTTSRFVIPQWQWKAILTAVVMSAVPFAANGAEKTVVADKTLVAWVAPANLTQRGGSVLTIERSQGVFDAIVFGEIGTSKWMAGSNGFSRTSKEQEDLPAETADSETLVQIAIVYEGDQITIYRNGNQYADYTTKGSERFGTDSIVLMGLRHIEARPENRFFTGSIDDARVYNLALDAEQIASLEPNQPSGPEPLAWWDFEDGRAADRMKVFPASTLLGDARIADGRLQLDEVGAYMMASKAAPEAAIDLSDASNAARALREKLLGDPYRPCYHFVVSEGRCMPFDPNGAIFWKGRYHLFYIFQDHRGHNWGHVSSTDLFHWRHHPTGLVSGMFSGNCFVNKEGRPTMCYHQVGQGNAMAVALDDELNEWEKLESNPITPETEPGDAHHGKYRSWDPYGWLEKDTYYAIFGGQRPAIAKSKSLEGKWTYVGDLLANTVGDVSINEDVSCADFFKLSVEMIAKDAKQFGVKVCCSPDGEEQTLVFYDATEKKLKVDTNKSSLVKGPKTVEAGPFEPKAAEALELRVFVDKSVVEVFANGRQAVMRRVYPSREDSLGVTLFSNGGPATVTTLESWDMMPSNPY